MDHWFDWILGALAGLYMWILKRETKRTDDLETNVNNLKVHCITRDEFDRKMDSMTLERRSMHTDNQASLTEIRDDIKALLGRKRRS